MADTGKVKELVANYLRSCRLYGSAPDADDIVTMVGCLSGRKTEKILEELEGEVEDKNKVLAGVREVMGSLENAMVFSSVDWSATYRDAWMYGIVAGWEEDYGDDDPCDAMGELAEKYGWAPETVERLRRYRKAIEALMATGEDGA